jgi:hypothetical protein
MISAIASRRRVTLPSPVLTAGARSSVANRATGLDLDGPTHLHRLMWTNPGGTASYISRSRYRTDDLII